MKARLIVRLHVEMGFMAGPGSPRVPVLAQISHDESWSRKGDRKKAEADRRAALTADPDIVDEYRFYGLSVDNGGSAQDATVRAATP